VRLRIGPEVRHERLESGPSLNPSRHSATRAKAPRRAPAEDWHETAVSSRKEAGHDYGKEDGSAQLVDVLAEAGVRRIYGVAGDSLNGITDSIRKSKQLEWAHMRHEEVAAFAAGAEGHSRQLAVCAGSCGPGNLHLINGLYECHRSRVPVLAIAAQIPARRSGAAISRRPVRSSSSPGAATTASWSPIPTRCRASGDRHPDRDLAPRRLGGGDSGDVALRRRRTRPARQFPTRDEVCPSEDS